MQAYVQAKEHAARARWPGAGAATLSVSIQNSIRVLKERNQWGGTCGVVKVMEDRKATL